MTAPEALCCEVWPVAPWLPEVAAEPSLFDWFTPVTGAASAVAGSSVAASCLEAGSDVMVVQPQPLPPWAWVALCVVPAVLPDIAFDVAVFDCVTLPPFPGLSTRIETFVFDGSICLASDAAADSCSVPASCLPVWMPEPEPQPQEPPCVWVLVWPVVAALPDVAFESTPFDCVTFPSSPSLSTRIGRLAFDAPACSAA